MPSHTFWTRWLLVASTLMALQGVSWILLGRFDPFGIHEEWLSIALLGTPTPSSEALRILRFMVGLLGATDAAFFVLFAFVVRYAFGPRAPWAHGALTAATLTWFILDSGLSLWVGFPLNVALVNVPCLLALGIPLVATASTFYGAGRGSGAPS